MTGAIDWYAVDQHLVQVHGFRLTEIEELTFAEIAFYRETGGVMSEPPKPRPPGGRANRNDAEIAAYAERMRTLTPEQKVELARQGKL